MFGGDDRASRPIAGLLVFITVSAALVGLAKDETRPGEGSELNVGTNQTQVEGEPDEDTPGAFEGIVFRASCLLSLGLAELAADACSQGFAGVAEGLQDITIIRTITQGLGDMITLLTDLATFNVPGAPDFIRYIMGTTIGGFVAYVIILVVRGVG